MRRCHTRAGSRGTASTAGPFTRTTLSLILASKTFELALHGTTMGNYLRCSDLAHLPGALVALYEDEIRKPWT